jgi:hypothetical protein
MTNPLLLWLDSNQAIFDDLRLAVTSTSLAAGSFGRALDGSTTSQSTAAARADVIAAASHLLGTAQRARALDPIPDADTERAFDAGLGRWIDAAATLEEAATALDVAEVLRAGRGLEAGTDEILRAASALRAATGQV